MPYSNDFLTGRKPVPIGDGVEVVSQRFEVSLVAADLAINQIGPVAILPAGHVPVAVLVDSDDLDTNGTPTLAWSLGVLNAAGTDLSTAAADGGAAWATGINVSQAGGQAQVLSKPMSRVVSDPVNDRKIALKATAGAATAASGVVGITLLYRPN